MRGSLPYLRQLICEVLMTENSGPGDWRVPSSSEESNELNDLLMNRWGGAGVGSNPEDDAKIVELLEKFPELVEKSQERQPPVLYRGVGLEPDETDRAMQNGLEPFGGVVKSWSSDYGVAAGFGANGVVAKIPKSVAKDHVLLDMKYYFEEVANATGRGGDIEDEFVEEEFLLRDFKIDRRYLSRGRYR